MVRVYMDFLDPAKKRAHTIRLFVGYILVAIAIAFASLILLLQSFGYDIDRKTGQVIQNGLIFVSSHPVSANVYLNGEQKDRTDTKLTVKAGLYTIELKQPGYRIWSRTFTLEGGSIERLAYPFIFPDKLVTKDLQLYGSSPAFATESPDRRWLLVQQPGSLTTFEIFDLNNPDRSSTTITLPSGLVNTDPGAHAYTLAEWSTDNRRVVLKHTFANGATEFIIIDREEAANSLNINKLLAVNPTSIALRDKRFDQLYLYDAKAKTLQTADLKTKQVTEFLTKVIAFKPYGNNTVLYVTDDSQTPGKNSVRVWDDNQSYLLHYYPTSAEYVLDLARFSGNMYMVVGPKSGGEVYIYKNPLDQAKDTSVSMPSPMTVLKMDQVAYVSFSAIARFIAAQSGSRFAIYDAENNRRYYYELKDIVPREQQATWMDGHRLLLVLNGQTMVFDFDGINRQTLSPSQPGFLPFFDRDYTGLYNIAPSVQVPGRFSLTRTELKVQPD